ncbi:MAG: hypothetical protein HC905_32325 [Bacteroidales bacterium]|nr:hypothetical protein [Bacteroidales bacterium]
MSAGLIILFFILAFIIYILVAPVTLKIDSYQNRYFFRIAGIAGLSMKIAEKRITAYVHVFFFRFRLKPKRKQPEEKTGNDT